jgi:cystathionine beta-lyase/cystathionine gamma-synthase
MLASRSLSHSRATTSVLSRRCGACRSLALKSGEWIDGDLGYDTKLVHSGVKPDPVTGAILTPIYQSTTYIQESVDKYLEKGFSYARTNNPTVTALENKIAELESGAGASCFGTGMAATISVISGMMNTGDHCVITNCSYGGTNRACRTMFTDMGMSFDFIDFTDVKNIEAHIKPNTKLIFSETPANPTLTLTDLPAVSALAKRRGLIHVCDSTFATPVIQKPIELGVDLVIQSTTKYYDGHNITVGGAVIAATKELHERIKHMQNVHGNIMSPQNAFYTLQTAKTMGLRVKQQCENAQAVAEFLEGHPKVDVVRYPGLESFPQRELAVRQHKAGLHGGMLWFEVKGGTAAGRALMDSIQRPWSLCENLGAIESICTCPAVMTHANMLSEDRLKVGITDGFVRLSCGIESKEDLIASLKQSLDALP